MIWPKLRLPRAELGGTSNKVSQEPGAQSYIDLNYLQEFMVISGSILSEPTCTRASAWRAWTDLDV